MNIRRLEHAEIFSAEWHPRLSRLVMHEWSGMGLFLRDPECDVVATGWLGMYEGEDVGWALAEVVAPWPEVARVGVFVRPEFRRAGVGSAVLGALCREFPRKLLAFPSDEKGRRLYARESRVEVA